ncbi:hypothetical protein [Arthrobacter sp. TMN-50]
MKQASYYGWLTLGGLAIAVILLGVAQTQVTTTWICTGPAVECASSESTPMAGFLYVVVIVLMFAAVRNFFRWVGTKAQNLPNTVLSVEDAERRHAQDQAAITLARDRDEGKCRRCDAPHDIEVYFLKEPTYEEAFDPSQMASLCPVCAKIMGLV